MTALRRCFVFLLLATILFAVTGGCGKPAGDMESNWRDEVNTSLASLSESDPYRYSMNIENWVGVSGQSVYGDEKGEGSYEDGNFSVDIQRTSPAGEDNLIFASRQGIYYLQERGAWRAIDERDAPNPLYDTEFFARLASEYGSISLEGEEEFSGVLCRRYLLNLGEDKASDVLPERAWDYFSSLDFELNCRVWVSDASSPPLSLRLEVVGFDREERLQRYRVVATFDPYDFGSEEIQPVEPGVPGV